MDEAKLWSLFTKGIQENGLLSIAALNAILIMKSYSPGAISKTATAPIESVRMQIMTGTKVRIRSSAEGPLMQPFLHGNYGVSNKGAPV